MTRALFTVTENAAARINELLAARGKPSAGIRIGIRTRGCSGMSYSIEYADEQNSFDEVVDVIGTQMDFTEEKLRSGFVFQNPNEAGRCGCGESFYVT